MEQMITHTHPDRKPTQALSRKTSVWEAKTPHSPMGVTLKSQSRFSPPCSLLARAQGTCQASEGQETQPQPRSSWEQFQSPSRGEWINASWGHLISEISPATETNEPATHALSWMDSGGAVRGGGRVETSTQQKISSTELKP